MVRTARFLWLVAACFVWGGSGGVSPAMAQTQPSAVPAAPVAKPQASADTPVPAGPQLPVVVVNFASIDQVLTDIDYMFKAAERPDMMKLVTGFIAENIGDLKGMNRQKPFGFMVFMAPGLLPKPIRTFYVPVDGVDDLAEILDAKGMIASAVDGKAGHYEITTPNGDFYCILKRGYAYVTEDDNKYMLEAELPEPVAYAEPLAAKYDLGISLQVKNVPLAIRTVLLAVLRQKTEAGLQKRDSESEAGYKMRRAQGINTLEFVEQFMTQCDQFQIGVDASQERKNVEIEVVMDATPNSELAKLSKELAGRKSFFAPLFNDGQPLTVSASWKMDKRERKAAVAMVEALQIGLAKQLPEGTAPDVGPLFDSLKATAEQGDMDFCVQFQPVAEKRFVIVGGVRILGGGSFAKGLEQLLNAVKGREELDKVIIDADVHGTTRFHQLVAKNVPAQEQRTYGGVPSVYLGASSQTLWFAVGADQAMPNLKSAIDQVQAGNSTNSSAGTAYPFQMILHTAPWLNIPPANDVDASRMDFAKQALRADSDSLRISVQPTDSGTRSRMVFDEGFIKLLGMVIGRQYDRSQL